MMQLIIDACEIGRNYFDEIFLKLAVVLIIVMFGDTILEVAHSAHDTYYQALLAQL